MVLACIVPLTATINPSAAQTSSNEADDTATGIVAAQIRAEGYACDEPSNAKRDQEASEPDETAWILTCENATYRVKLVLAMAAQIEQLD
jgi:hypothetical protein